jgi:hypothetical protein
VIPTHEQILIRKLDDGGCVIVKRFHRKDEFGFVKRFVGGKCNAGAKQKANSERQERGPHRRIIVRLQGSDLDESCV